MKKFNLVLLLFQAQLFAQVTNFAEVFELPTEVKETSGLIFLNNKIITHNDSGGEAKLYEIDNTSGVITREVLINNATNVDWESIAQDDTHIYIADIGNNNGDRQNLTIYKVLKSDYLSKNIVSAEKITYSYEDQTDFTSQPSNTNFDAEAIAVYQSKIFVFTKNWIDMKTNVYTIPNNSGNYTANKVSSFDVMGLITDANYNSFDDSFMLIGYDTTLNPFLIYIDSNRAQGDDIFNSNPQKIFLIQELGSGNQVEGVTNFSSTEYYISREYFTIVFNGNQIEVNQKLFQFQNLGSSLLSSEEVKYDALVTIKPNPSTDYIYIDMNSNNERVSQIHLFNAQGKKVKGMFSKKIINIKDLSKGLYYIEIILQSKKRIVKKIIKG